MLCCNVAFVGWIQVRQNGTVLTLGSSFCVWLSHVTLTSCSPEHLLQATLTPSLLCAHACMLDFLSCRYSRTFTKTKCQLFCTVELLMSTAPAITLWTSKHLSHNNFRPCLSSPGLKEQDQVDLGGCPGRACPFFREGNLSAT